MTIVSIAFTTNPVVSHGSVYVHLTLFLLTHLIWLCLIGGPIPGAVNVFDQISHIFWAGGGTASIQKSYVLHQRNKSK